MLRWERRGAVGLAVIDRPERRNALDAELCRRLHDELLADRGLRAVVITGAGSAFCAGADLARRAAETAPAGADGGRLEHGGNDTVRPALERLLDSIVDYPAPVIGAVNGPALGAGMQLAVACDLRVVAPTAVFGIPAAKLGIVLSAVNVERLVRLVGQPTARELLLAARVLSADEACAVGLVQRTADDALAAALAWAEELATLAPLSIAAHKRALNLIAGAARLDDPARTELAEREARAFASRDLQEGLASFAEKRTPQFTGE